MRYEVLGVAEGELLLDLGCGAGRHSFEGLMRGATVVAADLDDAALKDVRAWAEAMLEEGQVPGGAVLSCAVSDALALPFPEEAFDRIIVSEVLEHVPRDERALSEIERVLKPGGEVAVSVPRWWPEAVCWLLSREYHSNRGGHVRIYRRRQLRARARGAGLEPYRSHHAHALHAPYWWLKCLFGVRDEEARLPALYHRFLVWDIERPRRWVRALERLLDPVLGKSLVLYLTKAR